MKENILKLREEGKSYREIEQILGCSKGTISYHLGKGVKERTILRSRAERPRVSKKLSGFKRRAMGDYKVSSGTKTTKIDFGIDDFYSKVGIEPKCYLTGDPINLSNEKSWHLDHIIPISKGGENELDNLQITTREANQAKNDLLLNDFIELCKKVLIHHGHTVEKN